MSELGTWKDTSQNKDLMRGNRRRKKKKTPKKSKRPWGKW